MSKITGVEAEVLPVETLTANKEIGIPSIRVRIDNGGIQMVKVGDTIMGVMTHRGNVDMAGEDTITITGVNRTIIEAEAGGGTHSKTMISRASHTVLMVIMVNTPHHNNNTIANNPDRRSHSRLPISVNCVTIKDTLTTNVSLQVILWPELNRPLTKADNTTTKMDKANGLKLIIIMKIPMTSLFSKEGPRCC